MLHFAGFKIDLARAELRQPDGEVIHLRPKSLVLLQYFAQNAGRIISKQELMEAVWPNVHVSEDSLFQCVREIRSAIGDDKRLLIKAVSGRGYMLDSAVAGSAREDALSPAGNAVPLPELVSKTVGTAARAATILAARVFPLKLRPKTAFVGVGMAVCAIGLAAATPFFRARVFAPRPPIVAVTPVAAASADAIVGSMALNVTGVLADGLSRISGIRVLAPPTQSNVKTVSGSSVRSDLILRSDLELTEGTWLLRARIVDTSTDEVRWTTSASVSTRTANTDLQRSRLAAGVGYPLAARISAMIHSGLREGNANVVVDQATAFIDKTTRERFDMAQGMLDRALAADPNNVDLQAALAAQLLRGIQTDWYHGPQAEEAERKAKDLLARAVKAEPNYIPVLEANCRFLTATNQFADSLIACAKALRFDPWDGLVLFQMGMSQLQLGRFDDALATFQEANRFDTPQVSRWTWLLGIGLTYVMMDRSEDAIPWLKRSLAITPGTGRTHLVLAAAYERLGLHDEAMAAVAAGMKLRPGSNFRNVSLPTENASPLYLRRSEQVKQLMVAAGLPEQ